MSDRISVERSIRVYNDDHGYWAQVGEDRDGLEMGEILYSEGGGDAIEAHIILPWHMMRALGEAMIELADKRSDS